MPFLDCFNEENKPEDLKLYKELLCYENWYETCKKCFGYGNSERDNCTTYISGYTIREKYPNNFFANYEFYFYYNEYGQYRCTEKDICPGGIYLIKDKKSASMTLTKIFIFLSI